MGHSSSNPAHLHSESRLAAARFDDDEIFILKKTWEDLAERSNGKGIDKETFLQYFPLSGLLGERLFAQFDTKGNGYIDMDAFIAGLAVSSRGSLDDKIHFIFNMYDTSHDNTVSKEELTTLINQIPKSFLGLTSIDHTAFSGVSIDHMAEENAMHHEQLQQEHERCLEKLESMHDGGEEHNQEQQHHHTHHDAHSVLSSDSISISTDVSRISSDNEFDDVNYYTNHDIVEKAFEECDLNHEGRLKYEEFKMWIERTPKVLEYFESILPFVGQKDEKHHHTQKDALPLRRSVSREAINGRRSSVPEPLVIRSPATVPISRPPSGRPGMRDKAGSVTSMDGSINGVAFGSSPKVAMTPSSHHELDHHFQFRMSPSLEAQSPATYVDDEEQVKHLLMQALELTHNENVRKGIQDIIDVEYNGVIVAPRLTTEEINKKIVAKESYLWKRGGMLHMWSRRWYLLSGNCLYYYAHKRDVRPRGIIFLSGCLIEKINEESSELKGYYGLEIIQQDHHCTGDHHNRHETRTLYTRSEHERREWISALQHAAHVVPIEEEYVIGSELGRGRFSRVCECVHKKTGIHCAVKIIDKGAIAPEEKALLRTEIAVLKLVNHPNIIKLLGVYESKHHMYIVMEKLSGGELFERIVGKPRFSEVDAAKIIRPLLESVAYLHDLGIVHRDLKPENILCGDNLEDLKIADFGLSKMLLPKERMDTACGTLSYVAPEVLTMQGYGQEADLWSVGVIMFLLLCGKLPFDGANHDDIIRCTIQGELRVSPAIWNKLSDDARSLIQALLNRNPRERISARDALRHPFIFSNCPYHRKTPSVVSEEGSVSGRPNSMQRAGSNNTLSMSSITSSSTAGVVY